MTTTEQATTTTSPPVRRGRLLRRSAYAVVTTFAAALALLVGAAPAHASGANDAILINTARVDFDLLIDPFTFEPAGNGGILYWQAGGGNYTPRLLGIQSSHANTFDRSYIKLEAFNVNNVQLALGTSPVLVGPNAWDIASVDISLSAIPTNALHHVTVTAYLWLGNAWVAQSVVTARP